MTEQTFTEIFASARQRDLDLIDAAIVAIDREIEAAREEDEIFAAYFRFERDERRKLVVHGNRVKAAERRHDRAHHARIEAVSEVEHRCWPGPHIEAVKEANFGVGCEPADIRVALAAAREHVNREES